MRAPAVLPADSVGQFVAPAAKRGPGRPPKAPGAPKGPYKRKKPRRERISKTRPGVENDAATALEGGARRGRDGGGDATPAARAAGWVRLGEPAPAGTGRSAAELRNLARLVFEGDGLAYLQELISDPQAKDSDRLRAVDLVAKVSVGWITPDMVGGEDAPELPPPIILLTDGALPGDDEIQAGMLSEEDAGADERDDTAGPQPVGKPLGMTPPAMAPGPMPYLGGHQAAG